MHLFKIYAGADIMYDAMKENVAIHMHNYNESYQAMQLWLKSD